MGRPKGSRNLFHKVGSRRSDPNWNAVREYGEKSARGNFTRGADRRGNRAGAKPIYTDDSALLSHHVLKLNPRHKALAKSLGGGMICRGLRQALDLAAHALPLWAQDLYQVDERLLLCYARRDFRRMTAEMHVAVRKALLETWYEPSLTVEQMQARTEAEADTREAIRKEMLEIKRQAQLQGWVTPKAMQPAGDLVNELQEQGKK